METPLVSISMVAFNAEPYIRDAIEGCLMQEVDFPYEIIIHDDASSDKTPDIVKEYAEKYPEIVIPIIQSQNQFSQGIEIIARNILPKARGKYIAFVEADDYWIDPDKLSLQTGLLESHPEASMCFTATKHIFLSGSKKPRLKRYQKTDGVCSPKDLILKGGRLVDMVSVMVKKSVFDDVPEWYFYKQIWDVTIPLLSLLHGSIHYLDRVTSVYRYSVPGSWTQNNIKYKERRRKNLEKSVMMYDELNQHSNHQYHEFITKKINALIVEILLLSPDEHHDPSSYYSRLPFIKKLEYRLFNLFGSFWLWEKYVQAKRLLKSL
jgi:glycosyltransferase involved in cell wall biosynthesis